MNFPFFFFFEARREGDFFVINRGFYLCQKLIPEINLTLLLWRFFLLNTEEFIFLMHQLYYYVEFERDLGWVGGREGGRGCSI